jgi:hypothetical protein
MFVAMIGLIPLVSLDIWAYKSRVESIRPNLIKLNLQSSSYCQVRTATTTADSGGDGGLLHTTMLYQAKEYSEVSSSQNHIQNNNDIDDDVKFNTSVSIVFTLLAALAIAISYADRSNLSTAIIPMADQFHWDGFFSGLVLSSFWLGYASTQILGGKLADVIGGESLIVVALLMWSLCTALTPIAANHDNVSLIIDRVLLGAGEGLGIF